MIKFSNQFFILSLILLSNNPINAVKVTIEIQDEDVYKGTKGYVRNAINDVKTTMQESLYGRKGEDGRFFGNPGLPGLISGGDGGDGWLEGGAGASGGLKAGKGGKGYFSDGADGHALCTIF